MGTPGFSQTAEELSPPESPDIFSNIPVLGEGCKIFPGKVNLDLPREPEEVRITTNLSLTLAEVIDCSLFNSRTLESAYLNLGVAQEQWQAVKATYSPDVRVSLIGGRNLINPKGSNLPTTLSISPGVGINHNVFTFGRRDSQLAIATANVRQAELNVGRVAERLQYFATLAYYDMQEAEEIRKIRESSLRQAEEILGGTQQSATRVEQADDFSETLETVRRSKSRTIQEAVQEAERRREILKRELSNPLDIERAELLLSESRRGFSTAIYVQKIAHRRLASLLMVEDNEGIILAEDIVRNESWELPLDESIIQAFQNRTELNNFLTEREKANQQRRYELAQLKPLIGVSGSFDSNDFVLNTFSIEPNTNSRSARLNISWQPFDFTGRVRANAAAARRRLEQSEAEFARTKSDVRFQVERAYYELEDAAKNALEFERAEQKAFRALELARSGVGLAGQLDLLEAQANYTDARLDVVGNMLDYNRALASLKFAVGGLGLFPPLSVEFPGDEQLRQRVFEVNPPATESPKKEEEIGDEQESELPEAGTKTIDLELEGERLPEGLQTTSDALKPD